MKSLHRHLLVAGLVGGLGLAAVAQTTTPSAPPQPQQQQQQQQMRGDHGRMDGERAERWRARMQERRAQKLADLKTQLRIAPAQESAWNAWTGAMQPPAARQRPDRSELLALTTPQRIDRMRELRAQRMAEMDKRGDATKAFYGALTQEQQRVFDAVGLRHGGGKGHHGGGHRHHSLRG